MDAVGLTVGRHCVLTEPGLERTADLTLYEMALAAVLDAFC